MCTLVELAKEEIEQDIQDIFYTEGKYYYSAKDFDTFMKADKHIVNNMSKEEFADFLKAIGSTLTVADFIFPKKEN